MSTVVSSLPRGYFLPNFKRRYRRIPIPVSVLPVCDYPGGCSTRAAAGRHENAEKWFTFDAYACVAHISWLLDTTREDQP